MPRLAAAILLVGLAAATVLPRRRPVSVAEERPASPAAVKVSAERLMLLFGEMPSRALH